MRKVRAYILRLAALFGRQRREQDLAAELDSHLAMHVADNLRTGMTPQEARRQALIKLGDVQQTKEIIRDRRGLPWLETFLQDIRYSLRQLRRSPGFMAVAVLTLALGIGANTAIFSVIDAALLRPLPYDKPEQLVNISTFHLNGNPELIAPDFKIWQEQSQVFDSVGAFGPGFNAYNEGANLTGIGAPTRVKVVPITPGFFQMLRVQPILGRSFSDDEGQRGRNGVALLSAAIWRQQFGGDTGVLNKTIRLDGAPYTVVGVMPAGLLYPPGDLWVPIVFDASNSLPGSPDWLMLYVIGRLKPGVTLNRARADLQVLSHRLDAQFRSEAIRKGRSSRLHVEVIPLHQLLAGDIGHLLFILLAAVGLVLLIACANLANLLLARAAARGKEFAVRAALGAGRLRLVRQLMAESIILAFSGGLVGAVVGLWAERALKDLVPPQLPAAVSLDYRILAFVICVSAGAVILFGLVPALAASRVEVNEALKEGGSRAGLGRNTHRLRGLLVIAQMALALILLTGAGLLARSFLRLAGADLGFNPDHILLADVWPPVAMYNEPQRQADYYHEILERIRALPGVESAAATTHYPPSIFNALATGVLVSGGPPSEPNQPISVAYISPDYFRTMGIRLLAGRPFNEQDAGAARSVVILSEKVVRSAFGNRDLLGSEISLDGPKGPWRLVVGVAADTRNYTLDRESWPEIFIPYRQQPSLFMTFVLRTAGEPRRWVRSLTEAVQSVDRNQPVSGIQTMDEVVQKLVAPQRFKLALLGCFAALALLLSALGLYGVISYAATERTHEIGVRVALGAKREDVLRLVVGQGFKLTLIGAALGIVGAFGLTRFLSSFLYGVAPTDPATFVAVTLVLTVVALLASYIPARRATKVDPLVALRYE